MKAAARLLRLLWSESAPLLGLCAVLNIVGVFATLLMISALAAFSGGRGAGPISGLQFGLLALASFVSQALGGLIAHYLSLRATRRLTLGLVDRLLQVSLLRIETVGQSRIISVLIEDFRTIGMALPGSVVLIRHAVFVLACFTYLAVLSLPNALLTLAITLLWVFLLGPFHRRGMRGVVASRHLWEKSTALFQDLVGGAKEVRLDRARHDTVRAETVSTVSAHRRSMLEMFGWYGASASVLPLIFFVVLGLFTYGGLSASADSAILGAFIMCILFLMGPLQGLSTAAEQLGPAQHALEKLKQIEAELRQDVASAITPNPGNRPRQWHTLQIRQLRHRYQSRQLGQFELGPVDLTLHPGLVLFVVGGNGSGKTTLLKLIAGLYEPDSGDILLDGVRLHSENRADYRDRFAPVFTDFCLFEGLANTPADPLASDAGPWLTRLGLDHVAEPGRGLTAQARSFSTGERKRVALLLALLQNKPIYLFDEFAADQDPAAKQRFYEQLVPSLASDGKLVIVVTHDDRYLHVADCVVALERGRVPTYRWRTRAAVAP